VFSAVRYLEPHLKMKLTCNDPKDVRCVLKLATRRENPNSTPGTKRLVSDALTPHAAPVTPTRAAAVRGEPWSGQRFANAFIGDESVENVSW
jgi:hypothetical protein